MGVVILVIALIAASGIYLLINNSTTKSASGGDVTDLSNNVLAIDPPGPDGLTTAAEIEAYFKNGSVPLLSKSELAPYENLLYAGNSLTDSNLTNYFNPETLGVAKNDIAYTTVPNAKIGATIYWDKQGIPHVYGKTLNAMGYGAGWAAARDRLFEMDVLRHYGAGTLAEFLGPSCSYERMDYSQEMSAAYTNSQLVSEIENAVSSHGVIGQDVLQITQGYIDGINEYITQAESNSSLMPGIYSALGVKPQPWTLADPIYVASLIGNHLGNGGGNEIGNAALIQALAGAFGQSQGVAIFNALKEQNDPQAPTSISTPFPYMIPGKVDPSLTAIPDNPSAKLTGTPPETTPGCGSGIGSNISLGKVSPNGNSKSVLGQKAALLEVAQVVTGITINRPTEESNAILVGASHSQNGHPIAVFGPQVGYFNPEILLQEDLHGPGYEAAGVAIPGASEVVEMGRGINFAWSATSANNDDIDQRLELLCNPNGGTVSAQSTYYMFKGKCTQMSEDTFTQNLKPTVAGGGQAATLTRTIYITVHGIVQGFTTASGGKPVAVVNQRSTYGHDGDSVLGFLEIGMPAYTHDAKSFITSASNIVFTFNWLYAGRNNIADYSSGLLPIRPSNVDPNLPTWGTGQSEWQGWLPTSQHPQVINPPSGIITSWNNKPAPMFSANDGQFSYGMVYRSMMLNKALNDELNAHGGKVTPAQVVAAMESAATTDLTAQVELPNLFSILKPKDPVETEMINVLKAWNQSGDHRIRENPSDTQYQNAAAIAIGDEFFPMVDNALFASLLGTNGINQNSDGVVSGFSEFGQSFVNAPGSLGSAYDGGFEGMVLKLTDQMLGLKVLQPYPEALLSHVCGTGISNCSQMINQAFAQAASQLQRDNGNSDVSTWTNDTASTAAKSTIPKMDTVSFQAIGIVSGAKMDWQNRPTFQQVVCFDH